MIRALKQGFPPVNLIWTCRRTVVRGKARGDDRRSPQRLRARQRTRDSVEKQSGWSGAEKLMVEVPQPQGRAQLDFARLHVNLLRSVYMVSLDGEMVVIPLQRERCRVLTILIRLFMATVPSNLIPRDHRLLS